MITDNKDIFYLMKYFMNYENILKVKFILKFTIILLKQEMYVYETEKIFFFSSDRSGYVFSFDEFSFSGREYQV